MKFAGKTGYVVFFRYAADFINVVIAFFSKNVVAYTQLKPPNLRHYVSRQKPGSYCATLELKKGLSGP